MRPALDVGFFLEGEIVHIDDGAAAEKETHHDAFFLEEILRCEAIGKAVRDAVREGAKAKAKPPANAISDYDD